MNYERSEGMELEIQHMRSHQLPDYLFKDGPRPDRKTKKKSKKKQNSNKKTKRKRSIASPGGAALEPASSPSPSPIPAEAPPVEAKEVAKEKEAVSTEGEPSSKRTKIELSTPPAVAEGEKLGTPSDPTTPLAT